MGKGDDEIMVLAPIRDKSVAEVVETEEVRESDSENDVTVSDHIEPTAEQLATLRRVSETIPMRAWFVVVVELCERFSFYGCKGVWTNYIKNKEDDPGTPGMLGMGPQGAQGLQKFFVWWSYTTPIAGGVIADQYWGRYRTITAGCILYIIGEIVLVCTSIPVSGISRVGHIGGFISSIIIIGAGTGGIKSNVSALVAEQCIGSTRYLKQVNRETVIVDPAVTASRIYLWFYFAINIGALGSAITAIVEHKVGFWAAYLLPLCGFFAALAVLLAGRRKYVVRAPEGSIIPDFLRALYIAAKNGWNLEMAKPMHTPTVKWDAQFIDEVKRSLVACKIFLWYPVYWMTYGQMDANLTSMGSYMRTDGFPNDILGNINPITLIVFIPIMDRFIYPGLRKIGLKMLPITRITTGFFIGALAMAYCAIIQHMLDKSPPYYNYIEEGQKNDLSLMWQIPAFILIGISEIFTSITGLEYAYTKAPASMNLVLFSSAIGGLMDTAFIPLCRNPLFVYLYITVGIVALVSTALFWILFKKYNKEEDQMNALDKTSTNLPKHLMDQKRNSGNELGEIGNKQEWTWE